MNIHDTIVTGLLAVIGALASFVLWEIRSLAGRFDELIQKDHVHRSEFDALKTTVDHHAEVLFKLKGMSYSSRREGE
jgi:hypothetical protein